MRTFQSFIEKPFDRRFGIVLFKFSLKRRNTHVAQKGQFFQCEFVKLIAFNNLLKFLGMGIILPNIWTAT